MNRRASSKRWLGCGQTNSPRMSFPGYLAAAGRGNDLFIASGRALTERR